VAVTQTVSVGLDEEFVLNVIVAVFAPTVDGSNVTVNTRLLPAVMFVAVTGWIVKSAASGPLMLILLMFSGCASDSFMIVIVSCVVSGALPTFAGGGVTQPAAGSVTTGCGSVRHGFGVGGFTVIVADAVQPVDTFWNVIVVSTGPNRVPGSILTAVVQSSVGKLKPVVGSVTVNVCVADPFVTRLGDGISVLPAIVKRILPSPRGPTPGLRTVTLVV
jgi:hypothetical protein